MHIYKVFMFISIISGILSCCSPDSREEQPYDILYAPLRTNSCPINPHTKAEWKKNCPFCHQFAAHEDEKHYILKRLTYNVIMLNLHPYGPGHIMVVPFQHASSLDQLTVEARNELMETLSQATVILKSVLKYHGINIGMNIGGKGSGGSIPDHIHFHLVPRWEGDTSFMASIAGTRIINCEMGETYRVLMTAFQEVGLASSDVV